MRPAMPRCCAGCWWGGALAEESAVCEVGAVVVAVVGVRLSVSVFALLMSCLHLVLTFSLNMGRCGVMAATMAASSLFGQTASPVCST